MHSGQAVNGGPGGAEITVNHGSHPAQNYGGFVTGRPMSKTSNLGHCIKNTCFCYILKQGAGLTEGLCRCEEGQGRTGRWAPTSGSPTSARRPQQGLGCRTLAGRFHKDSAPQEENVKPSGGGRSVQRWYHRQERRDTHLTSSKSIQQMGHSALVNGSSPSRWAKRDCITNF